MPSSVTKLRYEDNSTPRRIRVGHGIAISRVLFMAVVPAIALVPSAANMESSASGTAAPGLENLTRVSDRILCGSEPQGKQAFETLKNMGVNTVVSVDGAVPQIESAKKAGIRYIHIPVGYDGISEHAGLSLTRVVRETNGPIYFHCHHGRHRGPAAAAIACRIEGTADDRRALEIMVQAGTNREYTGLWRDVAGFVVPGGDAHLPPLVEIAPVESMAKAMVRVNQRFETLKTSSAAIRPSSCEDSQRTATQDALLLHEALRETERNLSSGYDQKFRAGLTRSDDAAKAVHDALQSGSTDAVKRHLQALQQSCKMCHHAYRN